MNSCRKILIAEDEIISAMVMEQQLESRGFCITDIVSTGEQAVVSAVQNPPDIVLMDIGLAGPMSGIEAAVAIKNELDIPLIFITGYEDIHRTEEYKKVNPLALVVKPFDMEELLRLIE